MTARAHTAPPRHGDQPVAHSGTTGVRRGRLVELTAVRPDRRPSGVEVATTVPRGTPEATGAVTTRLASTERIDAAAADATTALPVVHPRHARGPSPVPRPRYRRLVALVPHPRPVPDVAPVPRVAPSPPLPARPATAPSPGSATPDVRALLAGVLAGVLDRADVPADAHVFDDLGADSMVMARFCARVRKHPDLPAIAMQDVYAHPTIADLATALAPTPSTSGTPAPTADTGSGTTAVVPVSSVPSAGDDLPARRAGRLAYLLCGAAQLLFFLGYTYLAAIVVTWSFEWLVLARDELDLYLRAVAVGAFGFAVLSVLPIVLKWVLVGRWRPREFPIWGVAYLRLWIVKTLVRSNPLVLFAGTPIYPLYLRALGARIGKGAVLLTEHVPVCTDLLTVGPNALVRKDVLLSGYRAHDGRIQTGPVTIGAHAVVGENVVLDIDTTIGGGSVVGHASSLHRGQTVPAGETWHGSPVRRTDTSYPTVPPRPCGGFRKVVYSLVSLAVLLAVVLPLAAGGTALLVMEIPPLRAIIEPAPDALTSRLFWTETLIVSAIAVFGVLLVGLLIVLTLPRLLALGVRADRVYPLYGVHFWLHRAVSTLTNVMAFTYLFGDSSAIAHYLGRLGYRMRPLVQTGSNFGMAVKHENPYLTHVGAGTVVADGLSVMNADFSATSFRVSPTAIGARNFLGNRIAYPAQGRTGDDCLLATKVMVPVDGPVREGVGLLGSPAFAIPRSVARDTALDLGPEDLARGLAGKNRHNGVTMALHLLVRWWLFLGMAALVACIAAVPVQLGAVEMLVAQLVILVWGSLWLIVVERAVAPLQCRAPEGRSIYDRDFWRHERFWKVALPDWVQLFNGTPYKNLVWRMLGVRIGARVFDDGVNLTERTFTAIGDECAFNEGSVVQGHSQEDGAFKSDHVEIGARCTLGVNAFAHYGTTLGDGAVLGPDTFLMKGEEVPPGERWGGNPARAMAETPPTGRRDTAIATTGGHR